MPACSLCEETLDKTYFSKVQLKKPPARRKCRDCSKQVAVENGASSHDNDDDDDSDSPPVAEGKWSVATLCTMQLVEALRQDTFPSHEVEQVFGIKMRDPLGQIIYGTYQEILQRRLFHAGETVYGYYDYPPQACQKFQKDLARALSAGMLALKFKEWALQVVDDEAISMKRNSLRMKQHGFGTQVVHPTYVHHRQWMERFRG